jgi:ribosomal protein S18 acetylase RimI-like enzyme
VSVIPYTLAWHGPVSSLLCELPFLYPRGDEWLTRRLMDVCRGRAICHLAVRNGDLLGVAIETPKGSRGWKLSTLLVDERSRRQGVGQKLVGTCWKGWVQSGISRNIVTVRKGREKALLGLLRPFGFRIIAEHVDRYGPGRSEVVLARHENSSWSGFL